MTVYMLEGSTGAWDSYNSIVIGIYSTMWKAEMARESAMIQRNAHINKYTEEQREELEDRYEEWTDNEENKEEDISADLKEYSKWRYTDVFNEDMVIKEIEIDTTLYKM